LQAAEIETKVVDFGNCAVRIILYDGHERSISVINLARERTDSGSTLFQNRETGAYYTVYESYKVLALDTAHVAIEVNLKTLDPATGEALIYSKVKSIIDYNPVVVSPYKGMTLALILEPKVPTIRDKTNSGAGS
jgi:hypothetical protein